MAPLRVQLENKLPKIKIREEDLDDPTKWWITNAAEHKQS